MAKLLLGTDPTWIPIGPLEHPTSNTAGNLAEYKYEVHFVGTTCFTARCPHCRTLVLLKFQNDCCGLRSLGLGGLYYDFINKGEMPIFRDLCPFCRLLIAMRLEPQYSGTVLEKIFLSFVPMVLGGRLTISPPEGSIGRPSSSQQIVDSNPGSLKELKSILEDSGCLNSEIDRQQTGNLYWFRLCPHCQAATQIKFTPVPIQALMKGKDAYTPSEREGLDLFLLSRPGSKAFNYGLLCPSCEIRLAIELLPQKGRGYVMGKWAVDASDKAAETPLIPFGETGTYFNHLTASKTSIQPTSTAAREAVREKSQAAANKVADKDFEDLTSLSPCLQYDKIKGLSSLHKRSFAAFTEEQVGRLAPRVDKVMTWEQVSEAYEDSVIPTLMSAWLEFALIANGQDVNHLDWDTQVSLKRFVSLGWLFNKWQGNYRWVKRCPSADCRSCIEAKFVPIPSLAAETLEVNWSADDKASRNEYMLQYHWKDTEYRHLSWVVQCPRCNVGIKTKLSRCAFASYNMTFWEAADQRDQEEELLNSEMQVIEFGGSESFNRLTLQSHDLNMGAEDP